jgi:hypothetical protein
LIDDPSFGLLAMADKADTSKTTIELDQMEFWLLCGSIGFAMFTWQTVEKAHFKLFVKMLGAPRWEVCSAAYHSMESFEGRHKMVGRMAHYFMQGREYKKQRAIWGDLEKKIKDANTNRNKLAHYTLEVDAIGTTLDGSALIEMKPRVRPLSANLVDRLVGRIREKAEHDLDVVAIDRYAHEFDDLCKQLHKFVDELPIPKPQEGLDALAALDSELSNVNPGVWRGWRSPRRRSLLQKLVGIRRTRKPLE